MVTLKGKTLVKGGRFRGEVSPGESIHWTDKEQTVEVTEAVAKEIEADEMIVCLRSEAPAPPPAAPAAKPGK